MNHSSFTFSLKKNHCKICSGMVNDSFTSEAGPLCISGFEYSYCKSCDYYFINPEPSTSSISLFYNSHGTPVSREHLVDRWKEYDEIGSLSKWIDSIWLKIPEIMSGSKYLDFGCGPGLMLKKAEEFGLKCYGVEISKDAKLFGAENGFEIYSELSDINVPVFDLITAIDVIEHMSSPLNFLNELKLKLSENGYIFLRLPVIDGMLFNRGNPHKWKWVYSPYHLSMFSINSISRLADVAGMDVEFFLDQDMHCIKGHFYNKMDIDYPALSFIKYAYPFLVKFLRTKYKSETIFCLLKKR
jgi:SAM-dependent methyltransferase